MPRILVLSASVGAGHLRAAQAIELALRQVVPDATVVNRDVLEMTNAGFRRLYGKSYLDLVNHAPHLLGLFYDLLDQPRRGAARHGDWMRLAVEKLNLKSFIRFLNDERWDLIVNTHFLPAEIIASLRNRGELDVPQATATTDFETHRLWLNLPCEHFFTATEEGAAYLRSWGVPDSVPVSATGIPIHPIFSQAKDQTVCRSRHGLAGGRPVLLQLAGGFGVGPIEKLHRAILDVEIPLQLVTVAGKNEKVKSQLKQVSCPARHRRIVLGFTDQIDELMAAADLVVSKPGGLTTSESLARGAAMVIVNPIPGQESRNSDFLLENGAAIKANNVATLAFKLSALLRNPDKLAALKASARRLARPRAAFDVAEKSLQLIR